MRPFIIVFAFFLYGVTSIASSTNQPSMTPAESDEPGGASYIWLEAMRACKQKGLFLPKIEELQAIAQSSPELLQGENYWSSSSESMHIKKYWNHKLSVGSSKGKIAKMKVRCIQVDESDNRGIEYYLPYVINDVTEANFNYVIDTIVDLYQPIFDKVDKQLRIEKRWQSDATQATSWFAEYNDREKGKIIEQRSIEFFGGLARHPMLNMDGFALVVCHEIGHHIGGMPYALGYTSEAQSDYFATAKCMKHYLEVTKLSSNLPTNIPSELLTNCERSYGTQKEQEICRRNIMSGLVLSSWFAFTKGGEYPTLASRSEYVRASTLIHGYPSHQCRLDSFVSGALCPTSKDEMFSYSDIKKGACNRSQGYEREARPLCWYNPNDILLKLVQIN